MESLLLVVAVGALLLILRLTRHQSRERSSSATQPSRKKSADIPSIKTTTDKPPRFDAQHAKHLHEKRTLTGAAYIVDGDTIKIMKTQIRLFGIDAPEMNHPYGKKAKWALHKLCRGQIIRAEITDVDQHGRTVARCFLPDGRDLSAEMVKQGLAIDWPKFSNGIYKNFETTDVRKRLFLADARQKGRMQVWETFEARRSNRR